MNYNMKHKLRDAKIIDYSVVLVMFPMILLGSLLGVQVNVLLPEAILLISLTIVLIFLSVQSVYASIKFRKKENKEIKEKQAVQNLENEVADESHEHTNRNIISSDDKSKEQPNMSSLPPISLTKAQHDEESEEKEEIKESNPPSINCEKPDEEKADIEQEIIAEENDNPPKVHPKLVKIISRERTH